MRAVLYLAVVFLLTFSPALLAGEKEDALALLDKAVKAHGGETRMARTTRFKRQGVGTLTVINKAMPFDDQIIADLPDKLHFTVTAGEPGNRATIDIRINKNQGWQTNGSAVTELPDPRVKEMLEEARVLQVMALVPLKMDSENQLSLLGEIKVNDMPAVGILVKKKDHPDLKMYFDKKTNLLVKIQRHAKEGGVDVDKEYIYSDHKEIGGAYVPHKLVEMINGKKFTDITVDSFKALPDIEDSEFKKP